MICRVPSPNCRSGVIARAPVYRLLTTLPGRKRPFG